MKKTIMLLLTFLFACVVAAEAGSVIIIANQDVPTASLRFDELQRIFLGKKTTWQDGKKIVPICLKSGTTHASFLRAYLDMNPSQFDIFWKQAVFTGTGRPPQSLEDEADVVQFIKKTAGAVGYIDADTRRGTLKSIEVK